MTYKTNKEKEECLSLIREVQREGRKVLSLVGHDIKFKEASYIYPESEKSND